MYEDASAVDSLAKVHLVLGNDIRGEVDGYFIG